MQVIPYVETHGLAAGVGIKGLAWMSRRCRRRADVAEACKRDEDHLKRRTKQQRKLPKRKRGKAGKSEEKGGG